MKEVLGFVLIFAGVLLGKYLAGQMTQPVFGVAIGLLLVIPGVIIQIQGQRKRMWDRYKKQHPDE